MIIRAFVRLVCIVAVVSVLCILTGCNRPGPEPVQGYVEGEFEIIAGRFGDRFDIDTQWDVGGYVGGTVTLFETDPSQTYGFNRCDLVAEGRFTDDSTGFSVGLVLPFGGAY